MRKYLKVRERDGGLFPAALMGDKLNVHLEIFSGLFEELTLNKGVVLKCTTQPNFHAGAVFRLVCISAGLFSVQLLPRERENWLLPQECAT